MLLFVGYKDKPAPWGLIYEIGKKDYAIGKSMRKMSIHHMDAIVCPVVPRIGTGIRRINQVIQGNIPLYRA